MLLKEIVAALVWTVCRWIRMIDAIRLEEAYGDQARQIVGRRHVGRVEAEGSAKRRVLPSEFDRILFMRSTNDACRHARRARGHGRRHCQRGSARGGAGH